MTNNQVRSRVKRVINSCVSKKQLKVAASYCSLLLKKNSMYSACYYSMIMPETLGEKQHDLRKRYIV